MAKKFLQTYLPNPQKIQQNRWLRIFGRYLAEPRLWYLHRRSVALAFSIGLFVTYIPAPGHSLLAALGAILFHANLPIAIALSLVVNPLTFVPLFGVAYSIGAYLLGIPLSDFHFEWDLFKTIWPPLVLGCLICGSTLAVIGNLGIRAYWRYSVTKAWKKRQEQRRAISTRPLPEIPSDPSDVLTQDHASLQ